MLNDEVTYVDDTTTKMPSAFEKMQRKLRIADKENKPLFKSDEKAGERLKKSIKGYLIGIPAMVSEGFDITKAIVDEAKKNPTALTAKTLSPIVDEVQKILGRENFEKQLKKLGIESDPNDPYQIAGELLSPTGPLLVSSKILKKGATFVKDKTEDFFKSISPGGGSGGAAFETAGAGKITKPVKAMDETKALNHPMIIGSKSPEGQAAIKSYENLRTEKPKLTQDEVYLETGVYIGPDGKYRYNLDNRTAKINDNFKKNEDIINVDNFKKGDIKTFLLKDVMDFKNLYSQYNKPFYNVDNKLVSTKLEDVKVRFVKEEKLGLGSYSFSDDVITINLESNYIKNSDHWFSTLLHETQHAIQHREGFITGANVESVLKKNNSKDYEDYIKYKDDKITLSKEREAEIRKSYQKALEEYRDKYGEIEARFVQKLYKDRVKNNLNEFEVRELTPLKEKSIKGTNVFDTGGNKVQNLADPDKFRYENVNKKVKPTNVNLHNDLNDLELITGYVNTGQSGKSGVGKNEIINRFESNSTLKEKSINALNKKNAINPETNTVTVYRAIITRDGKQINPENKISASLSVDSLIKNVNEFTKQSFGEGLTAKSKVGMFDNVFIAKYEVPKENVIGYLPAFKNNINKDVNKVLNDKGFGQEKIAGFQKIKNQTNHAKKLIDEQDEILVDVSNVNMQVMKNLKGANRPISQTGSFNKIIQKIATGQIKTLEDLNANMSSSHFVLEDISVPNARELEQVERQKFLDYYKNFFKVKNMNKGGGIMKQQMELFEEGGLKDEGNTVDPVSGNEVPPGSNQEEVRDDIPAQLSEGEFVFPADVVRYIGLEKLMVMRQEAKAGLARMEEMGQMGNSDEATLPDDMPFKTSSEEDDMPFTMEDLDTEEETEYNRGGVVHAQAGTFIANNPNVTTQQSMFQNQNLPSSNITQPVNYNVPNIPAPVGGFTPKFSGQVGQTGQQGTTPTFQTLIGRNPGQYDEMREYRNEAGMKLNIPFKNGEPIYPIPEGYTYIDPEATKTEEVTTKEVKPQTARVVEEQGGDALDNKPGGAVDLTGANLSYKSMFNMDKLDTELRNIAVNQVDLFNSYATVERGLTGKIDLNNAILQAQVVAMTDFKKKVRGTIDFNLVDLDDDNRNKLADELNLQKAKYENLFTDAEGKTLSLQELIDKTNKISKKLGRQRDSLSMNDFTVVTKTGKKTNIVSKKKVNSVLRTLVADEDFQRGRQVQKNEEIFKKQDIEAGKDPKRSDDSFDPSAPTTMSDFGSATDQADPDFQPVAKGGLLKKKKPKVKNMKRGGLASR